MGDDFFNYLWQATERERIGKLLQERMASRGISKKELAQALGTARAISPASANAQLGLIFGGALYGTTSIESIRNNLEKKRHLLAVVMTAISYTKNDEIVRAIQQLDSGFTPDPTAYPRTPAPSFHGSNGLEHIVAAAPRTAPAMKTIETAVVPYATPHSGGNAAPAAASQIYSPPPKPTLETTAAAPAILTTPLRTPASQNTRVVSPPGTVQPTLTPSGVKVYVHNAGRVPDGIDFEIGEKLYHPDFGEGLVVSKKNTNDHNNPNERDPQRRSYLIDVDFGGATGIKKLGVFR